MESLLGLSVAGFHGVVDETRTPANCGPIFVDAQGLVVRVATDSKTRTSHRELIGKLEATVFGKAATELMPHSPAHKGWSIAVVGVTEAALLSALVANDILARTKAREFLEFHEGIQRTFPNAWRIPGQRLSAWYCNPSETVNLFAGVSEVARRSLIAAASTADTARLRDSCWWLSRSSRSRDDLALAAAGLDASGTGTQMARSMLRASLHLSASDASELLGQGRLALAGLASLGARAQGLTTARAPVVAAPAQLDWANGHRNLVRQTQGFINGEAH